jgi:hypothetical protein
MRRVRVTGLALLALAVPPFALGGEEPPSGPVDLSVSASLAGCGLVDATIVCQIDAGWTPVEGAEHYTVSVTRPDGSVVDSGEAAGAGRSLFVPYVGPGTYAVEVAAWGTPPGEDDPEVLVREKTLSTSAAVGRGDVTREPDEPREAGDSRDTAEPGAVTDEPGSGPDSGAVDPPACEEPEDEAPGEEPDSGERPGADDLPEPAPEASESELTPVDEDDGRPNEPLVCP